MRKKFIYFTLFICLFVGFNSAYAQLMIDFGPTTGSAVESDYQAYTANNEVSNTFTAQTYQAFGTTITLALSWPTAAPAAAKQMWDRSTDTRYAYTGEHGDLIRDWTGTDGREANANPFILTLSGLPAGTYSWLSYHHDGIDQTGVFSVTVKDASGTATTADVQITNSAGGDNVTTFDAISKFNTQFTSNGHDNVVLEFTITSSTSNLATAFFVMNGFEIEALSALDLARAYKPNPKNGASEVSIDLGNISWMPGGNANTHNVFFGTDFNDVNDATATSYDADVTVVQGLAKDVNYFNPGTLEYGTTYFWRVDEINAPSSPGEFKGQIWSFTVEPVAIKLTKEFITIAVNKPNPSSDPNNTINEVGLDPNTDLHSTTGSWVSGSANASDPAWIRYDFDKHYKIHEMLVWNYNAKFNQKYGFNNVLIEYSTDSLTWTPVNTVTAFAIGKGDSGNACNTTVTFNDIIATSVRITALSIHNTSYTKAGLAEVRFTIIPTRARIPSPATDTNNIAVDRVLSWRKGREADRHDVYISTDSAVVVNHSVSPYTVTVNSYAPLLDFGHTYYWSVTEVNDSQTPKRWDSDIWNFTTAEYGIVDDFEDYNGTVDFEIWSVWEDGFYSGTNGSQMGLGDSPFVETTIIQHGKQSAPISYDNTGEVEPAATYSEVTRTFDTALNLKVNGADTLRLYYRGQAITFGELSGYIAMSGEGTDIGSTTDQFRYAYKTLTGNGSITARLDSVQNTAANAEAGIMIRNTVDANSAHAMAFIRPNGNVSLQSRAAKGGDTAVKDLPNLGSPYWVKITRTGNNLKAERSKDGINWLSFETDANTPSIVTVTGTGLNNSVLIGFAVTSRGADTLCAATFSNVATTGTGAWTVAEIGDTSQAEGTNTIDALYLIAEDSAGHKAKVFAPGHAVGTTLWTELNIPYTQLTGVDMSKLQKLTIGVGDAAATAKGKGTLYIDNISYGHPIAK